MSWRHRGRHAPTFRTHQKAHNEILANEVWFGDDAPVIGKQFTAAKAKERKTEIVFNILFRAAKRERCGGDAGAADRLEILADKLFYCQADRRCGSLACPECHRAFQRAKVAAQETTIEHFEARRSRKRLVMANVIPLWITYTPEKLIDLNVGKAEPLAEGCPDESWL